MFKLSSNNTDNTAIYKRLGELESRIRCDILLLKQQVDLLCKQTQSVKSSEHTSSDILYKDKASCKT